MLGAAGLIAVVAVGTWITWSVTVDDAFITYRYAQHWADGAGPVWNPGEDPVEGFTNFAWMAWHVPFAALGISLPVVSKVTSAVCALATAAMLVREPSTRAGRATSLGAYLMFLPTWVHVDAGLETAAFAMVVLRAVVLGVRVVSGRTIRSWELPALLLIAGMLRPEGVVAVAPALLVWLGASRGRHAELAWTSAAVLAGIGYFLWRCQYYGQLLPNTFYVKFGDVSSGGHWLQVGAAALLPLLVLAGALVLRRATWGAGLVVAATVVLTCLPYALSGPSMDYAGRFAFGVFPTLCMAAGMALDSDVPRRLAAAIGVVLVAWTTAAGATTADMSVILNYGADLERTHAAIGRGLAAADLPAAARTLATSDAGAITYYSDWRAVDYIGLNDEAIAGGAAPTAVVTALRPTVVVVTATSERPPARAYGLDVAAATRGYQQVAAVPMRPGYWQLVYSVPRWAAPIRTSVGGAVADAGAHSDGRYDETYSRWFARLS